MSKPKHDLYQSLLVATPNQSAKGTELFGKIEDEISRRLFDYDTIMDYVTPIINGDFPVDYNLQKLGKLYREEEENE